VAAVIGRGHETARATCRAPHRLLLVARTATLRSVDEIRVAPVDGGAVVTYDARLLRSALGGEPP
jgi:hypothetical protein